MPTKKKKSASASASKSQARVLFSSEKHTPCSIEDEEEEENLLLQSLEEASLRFPSLIGRSAHIATLTDVESQFTGTSRLWLSQSSMVSASLSPGSLVSVSLACSGGRYSNNFPLSSVTDECDNETTGEAGSYFAITAVFPSSKVSKNGVRFSANLSYTLGCPALGNKVFVYPIRTQYLNVIVNEREKRPTVATSLSLHHCNELYLELAPSSNKLRINPHSSSLNNTSHDRFGNGGNLTPRTPSSRSKLPSPTASAVDSPIFEGSISSLFKPNSLSNNVYDLPEQLKNERLLQTHASSWFSSCILLRGNFVALPVLSEILVFCIKGANYSSVATTSSLDLENERSQRLDCQVPESDKAIDAFIVNRETKVHFYEPMPSQPCPKDEKCDFVKLGGLATEIALLKDIIVTSGMNSQSSYDLRPTTGVLLHGPPGTGKSSLVYSCVRETGVNFFSVNGAEIITQYHGESEQALEEVFSSASKAAPAVVFIDELDAIAPAWKAGGEELSHRMVSTLLTLMDGISRTEGLLVIAATNRPNSIEPALRRPGRLGREIEIGVPSPKQRLDILKILLSQMEHSLSDKQVEYLGTTTHGFVGADLAGLCNEACFVCIRRLAMHRGSSIDLHSNVTPNSYAITETSAFSRSPMVTSPENSDSATSCGRNHPNPLEMKLTFNLKEEVSQTPDCISNHSECMIPVEEECCVKVTFEDFEKAKLKVRPSAMREVILEVPKVNWEDVGGQMEVKTQLTEAVEWPQKHQDAFKRMGIRPPTGVLLFGPPGCSKTLMARAVASEAGLNFLAVKGPELFSKWVGESEKAVRSLFAKARANAPSIIFFDEIDALAVTRGKESGVSVSDRVMSQLLVELDGLHQRVDVTVIAATNRPDKIDPALLRPGRFDRLLYVGPPNEADRQDIFRIHLRKIPCSSDVNLRELASLTEGFTGADISFICGQAGRVALEENFDAEEITLQNFKDAIKRVQPSQSESYDELCSKFQRHVHSNSQGDR